MWKEPIRCTKMMRGKSVQVLLTVLHLDRTTSAAYASTKARRVLYVQRSLIQRAHNQLRRARLGIPMRQTIAIP